MGLALTLLLPALAVASPLNPHTSLLSPTLICDSPVSSAGYYRLVWQGNGHADTAVAVGAVDGKSLVFEVEESADSGFERATTTYRGRDRASVITGRANGTYYYRARVVDEQNHPSSPWSEVVAVTVRHHSLARALAFFCAGAIVFVATLALIVAGSAAARRETVAAVRPGDRDARARHDENAIARKDRS